jgi:hypothetical protein
MSCDLKRQTNHSTSVMNLVATVIEAPLSPIGRDEKCFSSNRREEVIRSNCMKEIDLGQDFLLAVQLDLKHVCGQLSGTSAYKNLIHTIMVIVQ